MSDSPTTMPGYFDCYINLCKHTNSLEGLTLQVAEIETTLQAISEAQSLFSYGAGKWTIKQMFQHITDTERIFSYRALCFARGEQQVLPAFNENEYADNATAMHRSWKNIGEELLAVRQSTILLFESFDTTTLDCSGTASNNRFTVAQAGLVIAGHFYHHRNILQERYLVTLP
jgi:hypothetical protein